ncbi:MAG: DUF4962 domain-containing protein [Armatimonadota bacterium]
MQTIIAVSALLGACAALSAAPAFDERPAGEREWGFRPADGTQVRRNPPPFVWRPQQDAAGYLLQCSRRQDFRRVQYERGGIELNAFCPPVTLKPGKWFWRVCFVTGDGERSGWSTPRQFDIPNSAVRLPRPTDEELFARIPAHPRLFFRPEDLPRLREQANGGLKDRRDALVAECEKLLRDPPDASEPPKYPEGVKRLSQEWKRIWWGNRVRTIAVTNGAATLAFTYLLTEDERYAAEARRLLLAACTWDPKGATGYRYNDEAGMPAAYYTARAYTWLHDYLSEEDRQAVRTVMAVRGKEIYDHLRGKHHTWKPYDSHANRAWHWLGEVGIAFHGELPEARDWISFAMTVFFTVYPAWNDEDGGWHEGVAYWSGYVNRVTWWLDVMRACFDIDGYELPYFSQAGDLPLYAMPPGTEYGGFADGAPRQRPSRIRGLMTVLARHAGNRYWQWYAEQAGGADLGDGYIGFLRAGLPEVKPKPPTDLPSSKLFRGTGLAVMHSDLVDRGRDVQFTLKADPLGTQSHGYEAQNAFLLIAYGRPLLIRTGQRDIHGSPHHTQYQWHTKSVNSILVNGEGQRRHSMLARGEVTHFATSPDFDYAVGEAAEAYEGRLERFTRTVLFVKPEAIVIWDVLRAPEPATFQWLLHAPQPFALHPSAAGVRNGEAAVEVTWLVPQGLKLTQTEGFDPAPVGIELEQYHLTAETTEKARQVEFVTVLQPHRTQEPAPPAPTAQAHDWGTSVRVPLREGAVEVALSDSGAAAAEYGLAGEPRVLARRLDAAGKLLDRFTSPD